MNKTGRTRGRLIGGNLAVMAGLLGSLYVQIPRGSILFLEDIGEKPYAIDRLLWNLKIGWGFSTKIGGLIIGQFSETEPDELMYSTVYESIKTMMQPYNFPIAFDFPVGHVTANYPLLEGATYDMDVMKKRCTTPD